MIALGPCAKCGRNPALGFACIGDDWYCHPDEGPSCFIEAQQPFPLDDATLVMLASACEINPDTGRTHLMDFLDMGSRIAARELVSGQDDDGSPVFEVTYEDGFAPFTAHDAIRALVKEIQRLRLADESGEQG